jgi:hypothetical protein
MTIKTKIVSQQEIMFKYDVSQYDVTLVLILSNDSHYYLKPNLLREFS